MALSTVSDYKAVVNILLFSLETGQLGISDVALQNLGIVKADIPTLKTDYATWKAARADRSLTVDYGPTQKGPNKSTFIV